MTSFDLLLFMSPYVPLTTGARLDQCPVALHRITKDDSKAKSGRMPFCLAHRLRMAYTFLNDWKK